MTEYKAKSADELLAEEVTADFLTRQEKRRHTERGWQLNMNFIKGNQYCDVNSAGEIYEEEKKYFWQFRRAFNHIASTVDLRCSKLSRIRPALAVRAASSDESDRRSASLASAILASMAEELDNVISDATVWSETCGTAFYKVVWDNCAGTTAGIDGEGKRINCGGAKVYAVSPFEIYPYLPEEESLAAQPSIIHAKAAPVQDIFAAYGVKLAGRDIAEFGVAATAKGKPDGDGRTRYAYELVIERYERATDERPQGRLTVVAGGELLYDGALPYVNGENGERGYPFVRQTSLPLAGSFFGISVVDRLIPLQRAYNAVKNRKHEFLNRISMGTVAVEDGSVDTDELAEDGLNPGKIIVYRQGGRPPEMLTLGSVPSEFSEEEKNLLNEFSKVSGTGEITDNVDGFSGITSATGLQLIIEQDEARMEFAYQQIKRALRDIGRQILRLYRQYATETRLLRYAGNNGKLNLVYFKGSDISSDDVCIEADNEANLTPAQRRAVVYEMLDKGLLADADGKLSVSSKNKLLEMLGYGGFTGERDLGELNRTRAVEENLKMRAAEAEVKDYDGHAEHIAEHTAFLLTEKLTAEVEKRVCAHIAKHKNKLKEERENDS